MIPMFPAVAPEMSKSSGAAKDQQILKEKKYFGAKIQIFENHSISLILPKKKSEYIIYKYFFLLASSSFHANTHNLILIG